MNRIFTQSLIPLLGALMLMAVPAVSAEMRHPEAAIEAFSLEAIEDSGEGLVIEVQACEACDYRRFEVRPETRFIHRGKPTSADALPRRTPVTGTVIYDRETEKLTKVIW